MGARKKLNQANVNGALVIGAVVGLATQSWLVFALATTFVILGGFYAGDIRGGGGRGR